MHWTNEYITNFLEGGKGYRAICFFKRHKSVVVICFPRGNYIEFDIANNIITPFNSRSSQGFSERDVASIDKKLCQQVVKKLNKETVSELDLIKQKYTFTKDKKRITEKDFQLIAKYEQRKKGNWSDR